MAAALGRDRLRWFVDVVLASLDDPASVAELAGRVYLSRFHFDRLVAAALGESPGGFRRRLLLERAAWDLRRGASVTDAAMDADYGSTAEADLNAGIDVTPGIPHDFEVERPTVLDMLERLVRSKEIWVAAIAGRDRPRSDGRTLLELRERFEDSGEEFAAPYAASATKARGTPPSSTRCATRRRPSPSARWSRTCSSGPHTAAP